MSSHIRRLRPSEQLIGTGAIALFIFLFFFKWYGASVSSSIGGASIGASATGWHTFTNSRWIWLLTIVVTLGVVAISATAREIRGPVRPGAAVAGLGTLSTMLILYRILHHPSGSVSSGFAGAHVSYSYGTKVGIWLGLIAAGVVAYGGYLSLQEGEPAPAPLAASRSRTRP